MYHDGLPTRYPLPCYSLLSNYLLELTSINMIINFSSGLVTFSNHKHTLGSAFEIPKSFPMISTPTTGALINT